MAVFMSRVGGAKESNETVTVKVIKTSSLVSGNIAFIDEDGVLNEIKYGGSANITKIITAKKNSLISIALHGTGMTSYIWLDGRDGDEITPFYSQGEYGDYHGVFAIVPTKDNEYTVKV